MNSALFGGLLTGLILAFSTGPVFFTLLYTAIHKGFRKSIYFIIGISITDISIILICWLGLNRISTELEVIWMTYAAGGVLILFGLSFMFKNFVEVNKESEATEKSTFDNWGLFLKAILIDAINPIVWVFWAAISEYGITNFETKSTQLMYFGGILVAIFSTDLLKAYYAQKLKSFLSDKYVRIFNYAIGMVMIGLGVKLIFNY
jgi:threonine/homoserine/homoserine lactone efflux protein